MKKLAQILILYMPALVLYTCNPKDTVSPSLTTIKFELKDDSVRDVTGAKIYLFNNLSDWEQSKIARHAFNAVDSTASEGGKASINIDPNNDYYLLVMYKEPKRKITMLNIDYDSTIKKLPKNIDITVLINLKPVDGNLGFYSLEALNSPITIQIRNINNQYILDKSTPNIPQFASDIDQLSVNLPPGTYRFQAKNSSGCIWTGVQTLKIGEFNKINLEGCDFGNVNFYADNSNIASRFPITITINEDEDRIGQITEGKANYVCGDTDVAGIIKAAKAPGKYTYKALSNDNKCLWTGKFDVIPNQCQVIKLGKCE